MSKAQAVAISTAPTTTLIDLLRAAVDKGADVATLERLAKLYESAETAQKKAEFNSALADAKREIKPIIKDRAVGSMYRYETFAAIAEAVDPVLSEFGLFYTFPDGVGVLDPQLVTVCCRLSHRNGYSVEATRSAKPDVGQNRNAVQAMGSTITYLQRYTLKAVLGLAVTQDTDARQRFADRPEIREPSGSEANPEPAAKVTQPTTPDWLQIISGPPVAIPRFANEEWQHWTAWLLQAINRARTVELIEQWRSANSSTLDQLRNNLPTHHQFVEREINKRLRAVR
jgi:hypothetical protein